MALIQRFLIAVFLVLMALALWQCARRGNPSGGPMDEQPPELLRAEPEQLTTQFKAKKIRLYFDEYIKLEDIQNQLIVSPPLKHLPEISPQGSASKYVEIVLKDTLRENTTYTFNFGQSVVDNNEGNPSSFLTYVVSTGDYIDSLELSGVVKDAFNKTPDEMVSVMLYKIDTAYTDSTVYKHPPNYITSTLDSTHIFKLRNLKAGKYAIIAMKDASKNNVFDQRTDKIGFLTDTITLPTDSIYLLTLFKEIPDYGLSPPNFAAANKIIFGYHGIGDSLEIKSLTPIPDTVKTSVLKDPEKDSLNFWFTPFDIDSLVFTVLNKRLNQTDTFTVKSRKLAADSLVLTPGQRGSLNFEDPFYIASSTPVVNLDSAKFALQKSDSTAVTFQLLLDSLKNRITVDFEREPNESYTLDILPQGIVDFFENTNDSLNYRLSTGSYADYGNLRLVLAGDVSYPVIIQLISERDEIVREKYATESAVFEFSNLDPAIYLIRLIFDANGNGKWDTGNYLKKLQPERVLYYPQSIDVRANWELEQTFNVVK